MSRGERRHWRPDTENFGGGAVMVFLWARWMNLSQAQAKRLWHGPARAPSLLLALDGVTGRVDDVRPLVAAHAHTAIDDNLGARHEARFVGSEKQRRIGGVAAVAHEALGNARHALRQ